MGCSCPGCNDYTGCYYREDNTVPNELTMAYVDIVKERDRQDEKWGGPAHDDRYSLDDWHGYLRQHIAELGVRGEARQVLVEIAALAVAAIESIDRKSK